MDLVLEFILSNLFYAIPILASFRLRLDTEKEKKFVEVIDEKVQQFVAVLGVRGEGKSWFLDAELEKKYWDGYTILDLHAADNLENAFSALWYKILENGKKIFFRPIPVCLVASKSIVYDQKQFDRYNSKEVTEEEFYKKYPYETYHKLYNAVNPPRIPFKNPLISIRTIPLVTAPGKGDVETKANQNALEEITKIILECREKRMKFTLNRVLFPNEKQYQYTQALIIRNLHVIADRHFTYLRPEAVGKKRRQDMTPQQRNWHKMLMVTRELGELCPSRKLKADQSGESIHIKKACIIFVRKSRHTLIDWLADWQKNNDVDDMVRGQINKWVFKMYNQGLAGADQTHLFWVIDNIRASMIEKYGVIKGKLLALSLFPKIEKLSEKYFYLYAYGELNPVREVKPLQHRHKEPVEKFWEETGIEFEFNYDLLEEAKDKEKTTDSDEKNLYFYAKNIREKTMKLMKTTRGINKPILKELAKAKRDGLIKTNYEFEGPKAMTPTAFSTYFGRWKGKYEGKDESQDDEA